MNKLIRIKNKSPVFKIFTLFNKKDWIKLAVGLFLVMTSATCDLLNPYFFAKILNSITINAHDLVWADIEWINLIFMFVCAFIGFAAQSVGVIISTSVAIKTGANLRLNTFNHSQHVAAADLDKIGSSSIITRISNDAGYIVDFLKSYNTIAMRAVCLLTGGLILSIVQLVQFDGDPTIWYICFAYTFVVIFLCITFVLTKKSTPIFNASREAIDTNNTIMEENIVGNKILRIYNLQKNQRTRYKKGNTNLLGYSIKTDQVVAVILPIANFMINLSTIAILIFGGMYAWNSNPAQFNSTIKLVGVIMSFIQYLTLMMFGMNLLSQFTYIWVRASVCSRRLFQIMEIENSIIDDCDPQMITEPTIEFKNVNFAYSSNDKIHLAKNVLCNINLKIPAGSSLGIVGQTGSGKTTLINCISRLYDVSSGEVLISGINVKKINLANLHQQIAVSLQDKVILHGTIMSNILLGKEDATHEEIIVAAKQAQAWEFITNRQGQLEAKVEQRGSNLSGGQKQRLSIARALIKCPKILIFDDSTSALDTLTEKRILRTLNKDFAKTTKIIVSQKIKSIQKCDNIIVLNEGRIVQQGKHDELMNNEKGIYRKIYDSQNTSLE